MIEILQVGFGEYISLSNTLGQSLDDTRETRYKWMFLVDLWHFIPND